MNEPWQQEKWFVSYLNYAEDVVSNFSFPPEIKIHDITLRDGEQQAGIAFAREDKIRIGEKLAEVGVHRLEAGMPAVSRDDEEAIKDLVQRQLGPEIFCFARCMKDDIDRAVDCGVSGVVVEIPASQHMLEYAYGWPLEKAVYLSVEATAYAREKGLYTVFFPIDATRAEMDWFLELIENVATQGHMDALAIVDTLGGTSPHAVDYLVRKVKSKIKKPLEAHFHDDFGLAAANTLVALAAGAEVAHTTVSSLGERAGNAALEDVCLALLTLYGINVGLRYEKLYELSKLVREVAGIQLPPNRPIVGDRIFDTEAGIIASWLIRCKDSRPTELYPFHWDLVGHKPAEVMLGKYSGKPSIIYWLEKLGIKTTDEQVNQLLLAVKDKSVELKRDLSVEEFEELAEKTLGTTGGA